MARLKIYTDENVDVRVAEGLGRLGVKASTVYDEGKTGLAEACCYLRRTDVFA